MSICCCSPSHKRVLMFIAPSSEFVYVNLLILCFSSYYSTERKYLQSDHVWMGGPQGGTTAPADTSDKHIRSRYNLQKAYFNNSMKLVQFAVNCNFIICFSENARHQLLEISENSILESLLKGQPPSYYRQIQVRLHFI